MLEVEEGVDAISGRKRAGAISLVGRVLGIALVVLLIAMTVYVLF